MLTLLLLLLLLQLMLLLLFKLFLILLQLQSFPSQLNPAARPGPAHWGRGGEGAGGGHKRSIIVVSSMG